MEIRHNQFIKIIGLIAASIVLILGILAMIFIKSYDESWYVGLSFAIISVMYFAVAIFLKIKNDKRISNRHNKI